ncbi:uncharacterized protein LOC121917871 [Sceloporus undulatus]|uniref:uncharacterized protein LOC121917871 n=1 Tax=Sceloporus undulatus TaxID=8520 RepID=UPI001C4BB0E3|nr:uncharacterized protein LOC121917871 [Sceloporus undulatus]
MVGRHFRSGRKWSLLRALAPPLSCSLAPDSPGGSGGRFRWSQEEEEEEATHKKRKRNCAFRRERMAKEALRNELRGKMEEEQPLQNDTGKGMAAQQKLEAQATDNGLRKEVSPLVFSSNPLSFLTTSSAPDCLSIYSLKCFHPILLGNVCIQSKAAEAPLRMWCHALCMDGHVQCILHSVPIWSLGSSLLCCCFSLGLCKSSCGFTLYTSPRSDPEFPCSPSFPRSNLSSPLGEEGESFGRPGIIFGGNDLGSATCCPFPSEKGPGILTMGGSTHFSS